MKLNNFLKSPLNISAGYHPSKIVTKEIRTFLYDFRLREQLKKNLNDSLHMLSVLFTHKHFLKIYMGFLSIVFISYLKIDIEI